MYSGEILKDDFGNNIPIDESKPLIFGEPHLFSEDNWKRFTIEDRPDYVEANARWESRSKEWIPLTYWFDYSDNKIYTDEQSILQKYFFFLYNGILLIGTNEFGPVNKVELMFMNLFLIISALAYSLIFSDVS